MGLAVIVVLSHQLGIFEASLVEGEAGCGGGVWLVELGDGLDAGRREHHVVNEAILCDVRCLTLETRLEIHNIGVKEERMPLFYNKDVRT